MAEDGEILEDPVAPPAIRPPAPAPRHIQPQVDSPPVLKRRRDVLAGGSPSVVDAEESARKRQAVAQDVIFRVVVPSRQIGKVIGQGGHRVQKVREDTKATIKIADAVTRHEERVVIIRSKDRDHGVTEAEKALHQIAGLILKEDYKGEEAVMVVGAGHMAVNTVKLLIAGSQAGSLIGISGQNIEELRTTSGAAITIFAPNQLPLCASACESDRVLQVSGEVATVLKAIEEIGSQLRANPPKEVISVSPAYTYMPFQSSQAYLKPTSAEYVTFEMVISETLVGGLIGRSGSNISRIRSESGAAIKVYGGKGQQKQRYIHFGGNAQQVTLAKQKVDEYIYSQLTQLQDTQQSNSTR